MSPSRIRAARVRTTRGRERPAHPLPIRIMHWIGAISIICMMLSGWAIYNASPSLPFTFPRWMTLGGWLAGGIAWHISVMWVLFADGGRLSALRLPQWALPSRPPPARTACGDRRPGCRSDRAGLATGWVITMPCSGCFMLA